MSKKTETTDYKIGSVLSEIIRPKYPIIFFYYFLQFFYEQNDKEKIEKPTVQKKRTP